MDWCVCVVLSVRVWCCKMLSLTQHHQHTSYTYTCLSETHQHPDDGGDNNGVDDNGDDDGDDNGDDDNVIRNNISSTSSYTH